MRLSKELKIGAIIVAALVALIAGAQYLKGNDLLNRSKTFYGVYNQVSGLAPGSPVISQGFQVGQVKQIEWHKQHAGKLLVTFTISNPDFLCTKDSEARIESMGLMGGIAINIINGSSTAYAQGGDTLSTGVETDFMGEVSSQLAPLRNKTESMIASIDSVMTIMESLLKEDARPNIDESFVSLRKTLASLENTSNSLDGLISSESVRLKSIFANVDNITSKLSANGDQLSNAIQNFSDISDTLVKANVASVVTNAAEAVKSTSEIMEKINVGEGSLGLLINDDSLYNNLTQASASLDDLLDDMQAHPKRYVSFNLIERKEKDFKLSKKELEQLKKLLEEDANGNQ